MLYADAGDNVQTFTQGANTYRVSQTLSDLLGKQLRIDVEAFNQGDRDPRRHHGRAPDPDRQPVCRDGPRHRPAHLRPRPAQPVHVRGSARHRHDLHQRRGREHLGGDRPERRRRQLRLERRQHRRLRPVTPRPWRLSRPAARLQPLGGPGRRRRSPSSAAPSTTRPRRNSRPLTSASISTPTSPAAGSACSTPRTPAPLRTPTRRPPLRPASRATWST